MTRSSKSRNAFAAVCRYPVDFASLDMQFGMVQNAPKYMAFSAALKRCVKGRVVADIGAGTGILSILSVMHGARKVFAVERHEVSEITRQALRALPQFGEKVEVVDTDVFALRDWHERCDVIVSETIGYLGFEENIAAILAHARRHLGAPSVIVLPSGLQVTMVLEQLAPPRTSFPPFLSSGTDEPAKVRTVSTTEAFPLGEAPPNPIRAAVVCESRRDQVVNAVRIETQAELGPGFSVTNAGDALWPCCVVPLGRDVAIRRSAEVELLLELAPVDEEFSVCVSVALDGQTVCGRRFRTTDLMICADSFPHHGNADIDAALWSIVRRVCDKNAGGVGDE